MIAGFIFLPKNLVMKVAAGAVRLGFIHQLISLNAYDRPYFSTTRMKAVQFDGFPL